MGTHKRQLTMQKAYLNNIQLDFESIDETYANAIAVNEFPYKSDPLLQNLKPKATTIKIRCYFYNQRYSEHKTLLAMLKTESEFELEHPEFGLLKGQVESISVRKDDREQTAEIDLNYICGISAIANNTEVIDAQIQSEAAYQQALDEIQTAYAAEISAEIGEDITAIETQDGENIADQIRAITGAVATKIREHITVIDTNISKYESILNNITTPANALISVINFTKDIPGRLIGSVAKAVNRYSLLYANLKAFPSDFISALNTAYSELKSDFNTQNTYYISSARKSANNAVLKAFSAIVANEINLQTGYILSEQETLNVNQIENLLYDTRNFTLNALETSRKNTEQLKAFSAMLVKYANKIKIEREKITTVELDNTMPLHLLCLKYDLDYPYAEKITKLNNFRNPNFVSGSVNIHTN